MSGGNQQLSRREHVGLSDPGLCRERRSGCEYQIVRARDGQPLAVRAWLVERLADAASIVLQQPSMHHELERSVLLRRAALTAIDQHCHALLVVCEPADRIARIVVGGSDLRRSEVPCRSIVAYSLDELATVAVGIEGRLTVDARCEA